MAVRLISSDAVIISPPTSEVTLAEDIDGLRPVIIEEEASAELSLRLSQKRKSSVLSHKLNLSQAVPRWQKRCQNQSISHLIHTR